VNDDDGEAEGCSVEFCGVEAVLNFVVSMNIVVSSVALLSHIEEVGLSEGVEIGIFFLKKGQRQHAERGSSWMVLADLQEWQLELL